VGWSVIDFDWSNAKALWVDSRPMDDEEKLQDQVVMSVEASQAMGLNQTIWVYRGSMWAYPWYTSVRKTLDDPAYSDWFIKFKPEGPWYSNKCDNNFNPPKCSDLYHNQEQSPGYPSGDGNCAAPNCDCGNAPCGFYIWNHSSTTLVYGQSFQDWFVNDYIFDYQGLDPRVSGFYFDDFFPESGGFPDPYPNMTEDMGLTPAQQEQIGASYLVNMNVVYEKVLALGKFSWQQMWNGQNNPNDKNGCCTSPLVRQGSQCAPALRSLCSATSPAQTRLMHYAFAPGGCRTDPGNLTDPLQDIVNFQLIRGPYALLGHGWLGCSRDYTVPEQFGWDFGEPTELCHETASGSGIFTRDWTKATVQMDCNTWTPTITLK